MERREKLELEMPKLKVVPVDFRSQQVVPQDMEAEAPLAAAGAQDGVREND
jgi:hypothetical protein